MTTYAVKVETRHKYFEIEDDYIGATPNVAAAFWRMHQFNVPGRLATLVKREDSESDWTPVSGEELQKARALAFHTYQAKEQP